LKKEFVLMAQRACCESDDEIASSQVQPRFLTSTVHAGDLCQASSISPRKARAGLLAACHDITALLAMAKRQPEAKPF
jgi:hypothetical protein